MKASDFHTLFSRIRGISCGMEREFVYEKPAKSLLKCHVKCHVSDTWSHAHRSYTKSFFSGLLVVVPCPSLKTELFFKLAVVCTYQV